jgi:hypothetical protein
MSTTISVLDTHAPLQLRVDYVNAKGKVVPGPANPTFTWTLTDTNMPPVASQVPAANLDVVTLTGVDGAFVVSVTDGTFTDALDVTVSPDQTPAGVKISVTNL